MWNYLQEQLSSSPYQFYSKVKTLAAHSDQQKYLKSLGQSLQTNLEKWNEAFKSRKMGEIKFNPRLEKELSKLSRRYIEERRQGSHGSGYIPTLSPFFSDKDNHTELEVFYRRVIWATVNQLLKSDV